MAGGLVATAFFAPFSATQIAGSATLGRAVAVLFALALAVALWRGRPRLPLEKAALLAAVAYGALVVWISLNTALWGCNCDGKFGGFAEFSFVGILALTAISLDPWLRRPAMLATLSGLTLAGLLALLGVGSLNSATVDLTQTGGRLSGTYGNANELGFALALAIPIAVAFLPRTYGRQRIALAGLVALLAAALLLTYSRGGMIAAAVGTVTVVLWLARGNRRRLRAILAATLLAAAVAAALYSFFERERQEASFTAVPPVMRLLDQRDRNGWDSRPAGPIPSGPSRLSNREEAIAVRSAQEGEGISYRWGEAGPADTYTLRFRVRAVGTNALPISFALGDRKQPRAERLGRAVLSPRWKELELRWRPQRRSAHASLFVWQTRGPSTFLLADTELIAERPGEPPHPLPIPARLEGSIYDQLTAAAEKEESLYIRSRLDAAELAVQAFGSSPLWGIGWATFPDYAAEHLDYGQLAAHDEYLSIAAELGLVGLGLLSLLFAAAFLGARRAGSEPEETAAIGLLAAAAAGLVFVEALPIPQLSIPIAIGIAVLCARRPA